MFGSKGWARQMLCQKAVSWRQAVWIALTVCRQLYNVICFQTMHFIGMKQALRDFWNAISTIHVDLVFAFNAPLGISHFSKFTESCRQSCWSHARDPHPSVETKVQHRRRERERKGKERVKEMSALWFLVPSSVLGAWSMNRESMPRQGVFHVRRTSQLCLPFSNPSQSSATAHCSTLDLLRSPLTLCCLDHVTHHVGGIICDAVCVNCTSSVVVPLMHVSYFRRNKSLVLHLQPLQRKHGLTRLRVAQESYPLLACKKCVDVLSLRLLLFAHHYS